ncbi:MAG TPA: glycosyltransferase family 2 protein [Solirubrobacteraceae bacterium]
MAGERNPAAVERVTVAIPVRDGGPALARTLHSLSLQTVRHELLVCDSGSRDGSLALARAHGARVIEIAPSQFSHGGTRNLLMGEAAGTHVALLTQDAEPADEHWLERLLDGFSLAADVGIVYGSYRAQPGASLPVRLELERWFGSLSPDGDPAVERLDRSERRGNPLALMGRRGFFTDANAAVLREAWERVPFRAVPYAEDRVLALDMLRSGYAKAYVPGAAVLHSHDYTAVQEVRRSFDEWRALREVYGWREPASPAAVLRSLRGELGHARRDLEQVGARSPRRLAALGSVARRFAAKRIGAILGSRADRLPEFLRRILSLERRGGFTPLSLGEERERIEEPH